MNVPDTLKYTQDHEWIRVEGEFAYVGVSDYAQSNLGDIVFVEVETQGETLSKGDSFGNIEAVKAVEELYMPVSGEVIEINPALESTPEVVNKDPYGEGWMIKVRITEPAELDLLLDAGSYIKLIG
ncbi:MAG: glycine cleavage system protein GcvH [Bacteroidales bacterium]|jgi:glycine cleavage system H protein|nr:glycine cleavage system protein GcvH [Bacteroidales bacterium]MDD2569646.1 glycine cleavage system protein GcvH [Bacteroidales bacterium]MDD2812074.1 glycine cleavage system protein GcvH [Bacteroidales bacterium]MDD3384627.1 glycine cleavage system protein GcvH [Bacteroidales bacterium]MDD3811368.1 glycine cleavage system protein GcvH [Bacteroidales bacterium]